MKEDNEDATTSKQIKLPFYLAASIAFILFTNLMLLIYAKEKFPLGPPLVSAFLCLDVYIGLVLLLGHESVQLFLQERAGRHFKLTLLFPLVLVISYLIYSFGTRSFSLLSTLKWLVYISLPVAICSTIKRPSSYPKWQDAVIVILLWLPIDFRLLGDVWPWPSRSLSYSMNSLAGASLGVFLFVGVRGLDQVGYRFQSSRDELRIALRNFVLFIPLALVIGFASGFLSIAKHFATPQEMVLSTVGVFILIAIPEELLFRGIIQNLMHRMIPNPFWSLFLSSLIFGASHLNNGPRPDWRYFLLATLAGAFYGDAYRKTQKLISPAILHTLVDVAWRSFFR